MSNFVAKMKMEISLVVLAVLCTSAFANLSPPKIQVYSRSPGEFDKENTLICHVSGFHPPDIDIKLMKNGVEIPDAKQTDLAFEQGWQFHLTKSVPITPKKGDAFTCKVRHVTDNREVTWVPDM